MNQRDLDDWSDSPILVSECSKRMATNQNDQEIQRLKVKLRNAAEIIMEKEMALRQAENAKDNEKRKRILAEEKFLKLRQSTHAVSREFINLIRDLLDHFQNCCKNPNRNKALQQLFQNQLDAVSESVQNKLKNVEQNQNELNRKTEELNDKAAQLSQLICSTSNVKVQEFTSTGDLINKESKNWEQETTIGEQTEETNLIVNNLTLGSVQNQLSPSVMDQAPSMKGTSTAIPTNTLKSLSRAEINCSPTLITVSDDDDDVTISDDEIAAPTFIARNFIKVEQSEELTSTTTGVQPEDFLKIEVSSPFYSVEKNDDNAEYEMHAVDTLKSSQKKPWVFCVCGFKSMLKVNVVNHIKRVTSDAGYDSILEDSNSTSSRNSQTSECPRSSERLKKKTLLRPSKSFNQEIEHSLSEFNGGTMQQNLSSKCLSVDNEEDDNVNQIVDAINKRTQDAMTLENLPSLVDIAGYCFGETTGIQTGTSKSIPSAANSEVIQYSAEQTRTTAHENSIIINEDPNDDFDGDCSDWEISSIIIAGVAESVNGNAEENILSSSPVGLESATHVEGSALSESKNGKECQHQQRKRNLVNYKNLHEGESYSTKDHLDFKINCSTRIKSLRRSNLKRCPQLSKRRYEELSTKSAHAQVAEQSSKTQNVFTCICGYQCNRRFNLIQHIRSFTEIGKFECEICSERFLYLNWLRNHKRYKHKIIDEDTVSRGCRRCGKICKNLSDLIQHRKREHSNEIILEPRKAFGLQECKDNQMTEQSQFAENSIACETQHESVSGVSMSKIAMSYLPEKTLSPSSSGTSSMPSTSATKVMVNSAAPTQQKNTKSYGASKDKTNIMKAGKSRKYLRKKSNRVHYAITKFVCACNFQSTSKHNLLVHIRRMTLGKTFKCTLCPARSYSAYDLRLHAKRIHKILDYQPGFGCRRCGIIFETKAERDEHRETAHETPAASRPQFDETLKIPDTARLYPKFTHPTIQVSKYMCDPLASTSFPGQEENTPVDIKSTMALPTVRHQIDDSFGKSKHFCTCGKRFSAVANLRSHICLKTKELKYRCEFCHGAFQYHCRLSKHVKTCRRRKQGVNAWERNAFGCTRCVSFFSTRTQLNEHRKNMHGIPDAMNGRNTTVKRRSPKVSTVTSERLPPHMSVVDNPSSNVPETTPLTENTSSSTSRLESNVKHKADHSTARNVYRCICKRRFVSRKNLWSHIAYSTLDRKFKCDMCKTRFLYYNNLKRHMKSVHKLVGLYKSSMTGCAKCGQMFQNRFELNKHHKSVHPIAYHFKR